MHGGSSPPGPGGSSLSQRGCPPGLPVMEEASPNASAVLGQPSRPRPAPPRPRPGLRGAPGTRLPRAAKACACPPPRASTRPPERPRPSSFGKTAGIALLFCGRGSPEGASLPRPPARVISYASIQQSDSDLHPEEHAPAGRKLRFRPPHRLWSGLWCLQSPRM